MKIQSLKHLTVRSEPWVVGSLLLYYLGLDVKPIDSAVKAASYVIVSLLILGRWKQCLYVATRDISLLLLISLAMLSVLWSAAPEVTSIESKAFLRTTLLGVYIAARFNIKEQIHMLTWMLGIGVVLSFVVAIAIPSYGQSFNELGEPIWKGIYIFKNLSACIMTITAVLFLTAALNNRRKSWLSWILFCIALVFLIFTKGKTALLVFLISLCLFPLHLFVKQQYKLRVVLFLIALLVSGITLVLILSNLKFIVVDTLGKSLEFNGRGPIWSLMIEKGFQRPWLGYGFTGFWASEEALYVLYNSWAGISIDNGDRFNAHSGYVDLFLSLGSLGFFLYLLSLIAVLARTVYLWMLTTSIEFFLVLQYLVIMSLINLSDTFGIVGNQGMWSLYVSFSLSTAVRITRIKKTLNKSHEE